VTTCAASGRVNIVHNATTVCRDVQQKSVTWTSKLAHAWLRRNLEYSEGVMPNLHGPGTPS
jgi:hypothetical protein